MDARSRTLQTLLAAHKGECRAIHCPHHKRCRRTKTGKEVAVIDLSKG